MIFLNSSDDIDWLFEVHLKSSGLTRSLYKSCLLYGNEDSPSKVELYTTTEPTVFDKPIVVAIS